MLELFKKIWQTGTVTERDVYQNISPRYKGMVEADTSSCSKCGECVRCCPTQAITITDKITINHLKCVYCGACLKHCGNKALLQSNKIYNILEQEQEFKADLLKQKIKKIMGGSLHIRHVDAGASNVCDFEMSMLSNPFYDVSRWGINFVASPRHADLLMITGGVTENLLGALTKTYEATPNPKIVMAVGSCGISGGVIGKTYANIGAVYKVVPVDVVVPGCPPRPQALLEGILLGLLKYEEKIKRGGTVESGTTTI